MIELLFDLSNLPSYQTLYYTVLLGLILKHFWDWNLKASVQNEFINTDEQFSLHVSINAINMNVKKYNIPILHWICKNIRKRIQSSHDDLEKPFPPCILSSN
ncbi:hypothetical protein [Bacillus sp. B1-b2]|uniref:hypothetical protein n=1 Tax=Bacillus sp. B1-b2 TaxID=2653201 RepID=UPI00126237B4|nr:hypothetical protein [Bacillus sp. B1-b2]KAB7671136.1 hypothetical protein F9279_06365 [Bacillus sp. B1-b2]